MRCFQQGRAATICVHLVDASQAPVTGLSLGTITTIGYVRAGSFTSIAGTTTWTEVGYGCYTLTLSISDTATTGFYNLIIVDDGVVLYTEIFAVVNNSIVEAPLLTISATSTTSSLVVTAPTGIDATHLDNAILITTSLDRVKAFTRVTNVSGTGPFTLTITPALPETPIVGDTFALGPLYINSGAL